MWVDTDGTYVQARTDAALSHIVNQYLARKLDTWVVIGISTQAMRNGNVYKAIPKIAEAANRLSLAGVMVDYEPGDTSSQGHATAYAKFLEALGTALHATPAWVDAGACLDDWSILDFYSTYAASKSVDTYMTMGTYNASQTPAPEEQVLQALSGGITPDVLSVGIGSEVQNGAEWQYDWDEPSLRAFLGFLTKHKVREVDVWRADIDTWTAPGNTQMWFLEAIAEWLAEKL